MHKHLKSVVSAILAVLMMVSISTSAVAVEQNSAEGTSAVLVQNVLEGTTRAANVMSYRGRVRAGDTLVYGQYIGININGVVSNATGPGGLNLRLTNLVTGEYRQIAVAGSGQDFTLRFAQPLPMGDYKLTVDQALPAGNYNISLRFL